MNELGRLRANMCHWPEEDEVDAVVIGTGAGGAPILASLAAAGRSVVALEAGPWFEAPQDDFATDELDATKIYWAGNVDTQRLSGGDTPEVLGGNTSGMGVGGSTLHWGAFTPRADARDLKMKSDSGEGEDWPFDYEELRPYYETVEKFLGVSGPQVYPWDHKRMYPNPPIRVNAPGQLMQRGFAALGLRTSEAPIAALSRDYSRPEYGSRQACVNRGFCHQGCRNGAKASMDVTYLPWAVREGAEIRPKSFVNGFELDGAGRIKGVIYRQVASDRATTERRQHCKSVFLCAGAIETPRLLLHLGLANRSGQVGRNYMAHVATQVWGTFDELVRMNKGFPATVISEDTIRPESADFAGGYIVQSLGVAPVTWAQSVARSRGLFGAPLMRYLSDYNYVAGIGINGECLPSDKNRLSLSNEKDSHDIPKPLVHFGYGFNEQAIVKHASRLLSQAWEAAGARDIWVCTRTAHTIGTCRMGDSPETSVVDPYGKSHDIENLWICDNSVFPSSLAANPALTIMALALRTAEKYLCE